MPCNQCQHRGKKANPNGDGFPLALLVKRQFRHIHTNLSELSFRFDSIRHVVEVQGRDQVGSRATELFRLFAEERHEIPGALVRRKERNDDLP
jgi:hypothetical protein